MRQFVDRSASGVPRQKSARSGTMAPSRARGASARQRTKAAKGVTQTWRLRCYCKRAKTTGWTVNCAHCGKWYHGECIGFAEGLRARTAQLFCRRCARHFNKKSSFLPKCRLDSCERPTEFSRSSEGAHESEQKKSSNARKTSASTAKSDAELTQSNHDQEFCGAEHRELFWSNIVNGLRTAPEKNIQILSWLVRRSGDDHVALVNATPRDLPRPPKAANSAIDELQAVLDAAVTAREARQHCGFDNLLLSKLGHISVPSNPDQVYQASELALEPCVGDFKSCPQHRNWPEMVAKRIELARLDSDERTRPDPAWLAKRAKYLVAGTTRYSRRTGWKAAYFMPYVWVDDDADYFLDNDPEPFWDKHF